MYNFDEQKYREAIAFALNQRNSIEDIADEITAKGYKTVFFVGIGGTYAIFSPYETMMRRLSKAEVYIESAAELKLADNKRLNADSLVITASLSGTTKETVEAAKFCRKKGATVVVLTGDPDTPLTGSADHLIVNKEKGAKAYDIFYIQLYFLVFRLLHKRGDFPDYADFVHGIGTVAEALVTAKKEADMKMSGFAARYKDEPYHLVVGSGNLWGHAYLYAMCIMEEMQWIKTKSIHAAEFFHGTLEIVEADTSVILMKGEDETRPLMERVENFVKNISEKVTVVDTREFSLPGIDPRFRSYLAPLVLMSACDRLSIHLEKERGHSLEIRRYYRKMEY